MLERDEASPSTNELLQLKESLLSQWKELPVEHQATMVLLLFQQTLEGEYGPWLRSAAQVMSQSDTESPFRFLPVIRIAQSHLEQANLTKAEIAKLDDEDLLQISYGIVQHYTEDVFWSELEFLARQTLDQKRSANDSQ